MDKIGEQRQTRDLMNVETFSQLPFIRPNPAKEKGAIRLFGIEFGGEDDGEIKQESKPLDKDDGSSEGRRFEFHYCFKNFPTSQALGGHQNAHKRERQNAKRSAANYIHTYKRRLSSHLHQAYDLVGVGGFSSNYAFWNSDPAAAMARFYGGQERAFYPRNISTISRTITGSPLKMWRVPAAATDNGAYATEPLSPYRSLKSASDGGIDVGGSGRATRDWYGSKGHVQDHVSLDLCL